MKPRTKLIKVTSRGWVTTSRGQVYGPITPAYREELGTIFNMIAKENATVVEILRDKSEVRLTIQNFDKNNEPAPKPAEKPVVEHPAPPIFNDTPVKWDVHKEAVAEPATTPIPAEPVVVEMEKVTGEIVHMTEEAISETSEQIAPELLEDTTISCGTGDLAIVDGSESIIAEPTPVTAEETPAEERPTSGETPRMSKRQLKKLRAQQKAEAAANAESNSDVEEVE